MREHGISYYMNQWAPMLRSLLLIYLDNLVVSRKYFLLLWLREEWYSLLSTLSQCLKPVCKDSSFLNVFLCFRILWEIWKHNQPTFMLSFVSSVAFYEAPCYRVDSIQLNDELTVRNPLHKKVASTCNLLKSRLYFTLVLFGTFLFPQQ